jgi:hypothetical protein
MDEIKIKVELEIMQEVLKDIIEDLYLYHVISEDECKRLLEKLEK